MKLKVIDIINLESELYGLQKQQPDGTSEVVIKGLLHQPLSIKTKYHLNRMGKKLAEEKQTYVNVYREASETHSPEELEQLAQQVLQTEVDVDIDLNAINIDDLDFETEYNYVNFLNLIS